MILEKMVWISFVISKPFMIIIQTLIQILTASVNIEHVKKAAIYGADISTLPPQVVSELAIHP